MDRILQTGLASVMSATAAYHSSKPTRPPADQAGKNIEPSSFCPGAKDRVTFPAARDPVQASYLCVRAWPWGDKGTWRWDDAQFPAVQEAWKILYDAGINFIDTAQAYGDGYSEELVGRVVQGLPRESFVIQTKYLGAPFQASTYLHPVDGPLRALEKSLERLKLSYVDIYLVHGPIHPQSMSTMAEGMAKCVNEGLAKAIGVANYDPEDVLKMKDALAKYGIPLATNQCEFSVLRRWPEVHGNILTCKSNGMVFQSYSSLAQGRLTGRYSKETPPPKEYKFSSYHMEDIEPTIQVLRRIAEEKGRPVAAVALNYNISKGALPVVGIRTPAQAKEAVEALGWRLTQKDIYDIDQVSVEGRKTVLWQQG
ncbi:aldo-keto reductase [Diplogelasinospora grovesii]|uniref:Aldo-keto reductase n=1 Tax=Diplogelasinospora grovesii TaxID=303347 RepID=A0AAN6S0E9_9PEZI|nr:aldo-keto reductase [Diplogelasinospora grovesii]